MINKKSFWIIYTTIAVLTILFTPLLVPYLGAEGVGGLVIMLIAIQYIIWLILIIPTYIVLGSLISTGYIELSGGSSHSSTMLAFTVGVAIQFLIIAAILFLASRFSEKFQKLIVIALVLLPICLLIAVYVYTFLELGFK